MTTAHRPSFSAACPMPASEAGQARNAARREFLGATAALGAGLCLGGAGTARAAQADTVFRVTAIPDEAPTQLLRKFQPLGERLSSVLGRPVEFTPTTDYAATVEALVSGKVDMAWFGGFTFVQADHRSGGAVLPIIQRQEDQDFKSVFITAAGSGIRSLEDLKGRTFSFGSPSSTSGHLMPRHYMLKAGVDPQRDLRRVAFSGAHDATVAAVAGGKVDAGTLNVSVWNRLVEEGRADPAKLSVFFTTPGFPDYNWTVRKDLPQDTRERLVNAFLGLDPANPQDRAILDLQRTVRFVRTQASNYDAIRAVAEQGGLLK